MISQCSVCKGAYSTKDFTEAKKRLCPDCRAKEPKSPDGPNNPLLADGRMPTVAQPELKVATKRPSTLAPKSEPKSGMAPGTFIPKPDDKFNQRPLVWAK